MLTEFPMCRQYGLIFVEGEYDERTGGISFLKLKSYYRGPYTYHIDGEHNVDAFWIYLLRKSSVKVVPRFLFDEWKNSDFKALAQVPRESHSLSKSIVSFCRKYGLDGLVLESHVPQYLTGFISGLIDDLELNGMELILAIRYPSVDHALYCIP